MAGLKRMKARVVEALRRNGQPYTAEKVEALSDERFEREAYILLFRNASAMDLS